MPHEIVVRRQKTVFRSQKKRFTTDEADGTDKRFSRKAAKGAKI